MEFRVSGFNRLALPRRQDEAPSREEPSSAQIKARSEMFSSVALKDSIRRKDSNFSGALSSALTLFGTAPEPKANKNFELSETLVEGSDELPDSDPSREDLENLRGAVVSVTKDFLRDAPESSVEDLSSRLDDVFGEGFSDLVTPRRVDQNNGQSEIHFEEFKTSDLVQSEREVVKSAVKISKNNFKFSESGREKSAEESQFSETSLSYSSGRYDLSFSPSEVSESSALTDTSEWIQSISRR